MTKTTPWLAGLPNPKVGVAGGPLDSWYRYYAGYSADLVSEVLAGLPEGETVLDPWNGTGTTTVMAARHGRPTRGFDVNPALVVVAKARLLGNSVAASIGALTDDIIAHASPVPVPDDPLLFWFDISCAEQIRGLQTSTDRLLVASDDTTSKTAEAVDAMSSLAAFFYVALFRTVRLLAAPTTGTNPTWWKKPAEAVLTPEPNAVKETFRQAAQELSRGLHGARLDGPVRAVVTTGDSRKLPLEDDAVGAALTSPPYCTRIDYAIATLPELAVLRTGDTDVRVLRDRMVGTPTVTGRRGQPGEWGPAAATFLGQVTAHPSKASSTYYLKFFEQYYAAMWESIGELRRVCRPGGTAVLIVQDNHYKDVHNDTPGILREMAAMAGFGSAERHDFAISRTMAAMNPRVRAYRSGSSALESVLVLSFRPAWRCPQTPARTPPHMTAWPPRTSPAACSRQSPPASATPAYAAPSFALAAPRQRPTA